MIFHDYQKALDAARKSGGTLKSNPNGQGWVLFSMKKPISHKTTKRKPFKAPQTKKRKKLYFKSKTKSTLSKEDAYLIKKELEKDKEFQKNAKQNPKHVIPEEYRRKADEGIGGSREDWKKNRRGYYGDMK